VLFHFDFGNWRRMLTLAAREPDPATRRRFLRVLLLQVPLISGFHALCFFLDPILFPALRRTEVRAPVFIVGHARSGTTLLHRLMTGDADRFSWFVLWELYFPSLLQKKAIRAVAAFDRRVLAGRLEARVRQWEEKRYGAMRGVHAMGLSEAEEDDIVLYYSMASGFWITKLPYMGDLDFYAVDRWPARKRARIMRFYRECVRRQLALKGPERTHLSKNPIFAGRVEALIETFPDARFVITLRNPLETIPSLLALVQGGWKAMGWTEERQTRCLRVLAEQSFDTYLHPLEVLDAHPETPHARVDYRALVAEPAKAVADVYRALGLELTADFAARLEGEEKRASDHRSKHRYSLERFGLDADEIETRLGTLFERQGWERAQSDSATAREEGAPQ